jgi:CRISP-associated protein Cas1
MGALEPLKRLSQSAVITTASDVPSDFPLHVPARMLNEFSYCPRLFHLEWVQGQFVDNADTSEGTWQHRAVDVEKGRAPAPEAAEELREARSLLVGSDRLGLIARIDVLEGAGKEVRPIDVKKGKAPDNEMRAYEPERVQLCASALILRDNGYLCTEGVLYFVSTKERVRVVFDEALVVRTLELLLALHETSRSDEVPPPLVDSPKCPRCSLVGICLPDETNQLSQRSEAVARRLVPHESAARPVYVTDQDLNVSISSGRLRLKNRTEVVEEVRLLDVSQLNVYGHVQVTTAAIRACLDKQIPVSWFSHGGWFSGTAHGLPGKNVDLRRRQVGLAAQGSVDIARACVAGKIKNSRTLLRRNGRAVPPKILLSLKELGASAGWADSIPSLLGFEGAAARSYFSAFELMIRAELALPGGAFAFDGRNRRPPRDAINCLLSYVYGLLVKDLTVVTNSVGFDPYIGFYHRPRFGRPALALDLAEEFRPIVGDSVVLTVVNNGEVDRNDFTVRAAGVALSPEGRKKVIRAYERRLNQEVTHPVFGYTITYRRVLEVQARLLAAHLLGEVPDYIPFTTR